MRRIAITNQKGGVAKTTTTVNLGACLAERGKKVLLIDLDPQANLTSWLGFGAESGDKSIYDVFVGETRLDEVLKNSKTHKLRIAPSVVELAGAEKLLLNEVGRDTVLKKKVEEMTEEYDYILFDCPPSLGVITINALTAAREVFIPVETKILALNGLVTLTHTIQLVKERINPSLEITGIIACMYDGRTNLSREVLDKLRAHFGDKVFKTPIRENVRLAECPISELPIHLYAPGSSGAKDYEGLAEEVIVSEKERSGGDGGVSESKSTEADEDSGPEE